MSQSRTLQIPFNESTASRNVHTCSILDLHSWPFHRSLPLAPPHSISLLEGPHFKRGKCQQGRTFTFLTFRLAKLWIWMCWKRNVIFVFLGFFLIQNTRDRVRKKMLLHYHRKWLFSFLYCHTVAFLWLLFLFTSLPKNPFAQTAWCERFCVLMKNPNNRPIMI